jgi:hypothetical protein
MPLYYNHHKTLKQTIKVVHNNRPTPIEVMPSGSRDINLSPKVVAQLSKHLFPYPPGDTAAYMKSVQADERAERVATYVGKVGSDLKAICEQASIPKGFLRDVRKSMAVDSDGEPLPMPTGRYTHPEIAEAIVRWEEQSEDNLEAVRAAVANLATG